MILDEDIKTVYETKSDYLTFLKKYAQNAHRLNYYEPDFILEVSNYCRREISSICKYDARITCKEQLRVGNEGLNLEYISTRSSGTTGKPFYYKIWKDIYFIIEKYCHYQYIAEQYLEQPPLNILYMIYTDLDHTERNIIQYNTNNIVKSHGYVKQATVHHAMASSAFVHDYYGYYKYILEYANRNNIDIILADGSTVASLAAIAYKLNIKYPIAKLLSSTSTPVDHNKLEFLRLNGNIIDWCDHMRCWDGGATFLTCPYRTKHLLDGLSWCYSVDDKLISDDYFSVVFPFYKYWNGDYATIDDTYKRCKCGRYYRKFELLYNRERNPIHASLTELYNTLSLISGSIIRIEGVGRLQRYFVKHPISIEVKQKVRQALPEHIIMFIVEEEWTTILKSLKLCNNSAVLV
jgi:hypothetical protein